MGTLEIENQAFGVQTYSKQKIFLPLVRDYHNDFDF